jgi:hypothetical protein
VNVDRHAVNNFAQKVQCLPGMPKDAVVKVSFGRRNARIYKEWGGQKHCWGWVDMTDGTIRRGGWKSPDMRVPGRGKITDPGIIDKMQWTGPPYL